MAIRRHSGFLPSNWAFLGFKLCSSSNKFIASLLTASDHSVYHSALVNVNMPEVKRATTYHFHPKWGWGKIIFFVCFHSKPVCLICNATAAIRSKGIWSGIVEQYKKATKGIFLPKPLCATKVRDLKVQLQWQSVSSKPRTQGNFCVMSRQSRPC